MLSAPFELVSETLPNGASIVPSDCEPKANATILPLLATALPKILMSLPDLNVMPTALTLPSEIDPASMSASPPLIDKDPMLTEPGVTN